MVAAVELPTSRQSGPDRQVTAFAAVAVGPAGLGTEKVVQLPLTKRSEKANVRPALVCPFPTTMQDDAVQQLTEVAVAVGSGVGRGGAVSCHAPFTSFSANMPVGVKPRSPIARHDVDDAQETARRSPAELPGGSGVGRSVHEIPFQRWVQGSGTRSRITKPTARQEFPRQETPVGAIWLAPKGIALMGLLDHRAPFQ